MKTQLTGTKSKNTFMFLAQPEDNNAVYKCEANNIMLQQPLSAEITLSVQCKILVMLGLLAFNQLSIVR